MSTFEARGERRESPEFYLKVTGTPMVVCVPPEFDTAAWWSYVVLPQPPDGGA